jgi:hypothetical protein
MPEESSQDVTQHDNISGNTHYRVNLPHDFSHGLLSEDKSFIENSPKLDSFLTPLESELGLPKAFFRGLLDENDWSFVIKLHSLIEAAATRLLVIALGKPELEEIISRLELSGKTTGKLAFFESLDLLDSESRGFIQTLSEVRNKLVHNVSNVSITLEEYVESLDDSRRKGFNTVFKWKYKNISEIDIQQSEGIYDVHAWIKFTCVMLIDKSQYKSAIWYGSIIVLRKMYGKVLNSRAENTKKEIGEQLISLIEERIPKD